MARRDTTAATKSRAQQSKAQPDQPAPSLNEVRLIGRLSAVPESRSLPSGDTVTMLRVVVARPADARRSGRTPTVDTVDCAIWTSRLRQRAMALPEGALIEVRGALRRRFWRSPVGATSRYEVEVGALKRVPRSAAGVG